MSSCHWNTQVEGWKDSCLWGMQSPKIALVIPFVGMTGIQAWAHLWALPWGKIGPSNVSQCQAEKIKPFWLSRRTNLWKRASWYWWGEEEENTERFQGPERLSCCGGPGHFPPVRVLWWAAQVSIAMYVPPNLGYFKPFHLQSSRSLPQEYWDPLGYLHTSPGPLLIEFGSKIHVWIVFYFPALNTQQEDSTDENLPHN